MAEKHLNIETVIWKGQTRYICPMTWESGAKCEFNHYDLEELKKHAAEKHTRTSGMKVEVKDQPDRDFTPKSVDKEFESAKFMPEF